MLAWVLALGSVAFAVVNLVFELTDRFDEGPTSDFAAGLSIANWLVASLKLVGQSLPSCRYLVCAEYRPAWSTSSCGRRPVRWSSTPWAALFRLSA